jgi:meso-butanediol dehydrogenase / (S,S)-butanediol dehydrogenase / diacetyl reductase
MSRRLSGKVVAVTGASRGMGSVFARTLDGHGAEVVLLARPSEALDAMAAALPRAQKLACDVAAADQVKAAFAEIKTRHGRLDALINNAAICLLHRLEEATDEELSREAATNLVGPALCMREAIALLRAAGGGDIVNVTSESVRLPFPFLTFYAATKAGLETLSAGLRAELRPDRVRVTVLRSGHVAGGNIGASWTQERMARFFETIKESGHLAFSGEAISPETTANMLVELLCLPREANVDLIELRAI